MPFLWWRRSADKSKLAPDFTPEQRARYDRSKVRQKQRDRERLARVKARRRAPPEPPDPLESLAYEVGFDDDRLPRVDAAIKNNTPFILKQVFRNGSTVRTREVRQWVGRYPSQVEVYDWLDEVRAKRDTEFALFIKGSPRVIERYLARM
jgi:hypothetical protein